MILSRLIAQFFKLTEQLFYRIMLQIDKQLPIDEEIDP